MMNTEFEWNDDKAVSNLKKHGVSFEQAALAFNDLFPVEWIDTRTAYGEERIILLAASQGQILFVVYTERKDRIRIISARRATKNEKKIYYHHNGQ